MRFSVIAAALVLVTGSAFAQSSRPPTVAEQARAAAPQAQAGAARLSPADNEAMKVVNDFMAALAGGQLEAARQLMTPDAVVMSNGQVLGDRNGYIDGAAKGDAAALRNTQRELLNRVVRAEANLGWVVSEKRLRGPGAKGVQKQVVVTETMLLAKTAAGWKITHIHWSGRPAS